MSHYAVMVLTEEEPTDELLHEILDPWHEFECTGNDDEYVQEIDETREYRERYEEGTQSMCHSPEGELVSAYDDRFYRVPTEEEKAMIGPMAGTGVGCGLSWCSKDWGDGLGYATRVKYLPEGWRKEDVPYHSLMTFEEYVMRDDITVIDHLDAATMAEWDADRRDEEGCKYRYAVKKDGKIDRVIRRTNPDVYDWYDAQGQKIARTVGDSHLPFVREDPAGGGQFLLDEERRLVHLLQGLFQETQPAKTNTGAAEEVASEVDVRAQLRGLRENAENAKREMRGLSLSAVAENWWLRGRPLPPDEQGEIDPLYSLQHVVGAMSRRHVDLIGVESISGPIHRKFVSGSKWDWWVVGGRYGGRFWPKVSPDTEVSEVSVGEPGVFGPNQEQTEGWLDSVRLGDMDLAFMKARRVAQRQETIDEKLKELQKRDDSMSFSRMQQIWESFTDKHDDAEKQWETLYAKQKEAGEKPTNKWDWLKSEDSPVRVEVESGVPQALVGWLFGAGLEAHDRDINAWIQSAPALSTFAFVTLDREWVERGKMGWWAMVANKKDGARWQMEFEDYVASLPETSWITVVDCHI